MKPFDIISRMEKEFEELKKFFGFAIARKRPFCDLLERENEILLKVDMPGFSKDEIDLEIGEKYVRIKAEKREEEKGDYIFKERVKSFYRHIELPCEIKEEEAKAKLKDGVLEIIMPKKERKKGRKIEVE